MEQQPRNKFRTQAVRHFLTYPQCDMPLQEMLKQLKQRIEVLEGEIEKGNSWLENNKLIDTTELTEKLKNSNEMRCGEGSKSFNSEKQNEPIDVENATFREEDIVYFDERELKGDSLVIVGAVDPSLGSNDKSNLSAIITIAKDRQGYLYALDADIKRRTPDVIIDDIIRYHMKRDYAMFAVESVAFSRIL